jgi:Glyoxalase-like domain
MHDLFSLGSKFSRKRHPKDIASQGHNEVALKNVIGIDHAVIMVRDLDQAAANWKRLGFTISPRGTHSAHMGSANYTIMLDPDYIELLGVLAPTEHNAPARAFLDKREGIERIAFTAVDSAEGAEEIRARGYPPIGPTDFERPVTMPDGRLSAAKFRTFQWPVAEAPGGVRIFACQHKTRETVWIPELMTHANGAKRLKQVLLAAAEPAKEAAHLSRMIDREAREQPDGSVVVASGGDRADFVFTTKALLSRRYPEVPLAVLPERGAAGLVIAADLAAAEKALGTTRIRSDGAICVPPALGNGTLLAFVGA